MMKSLTTLILLVFFVVVVITSFDLSYTGDIVAENFNTKYLLDNMDKVVNDYNQKFENIPRFAKTLFGNERINLAIIMNNNSKKEFGLITKEGKVIEYSKKPLENPTIGITAPESVIDNIASSRNPSQEFSKAIKNKNIILEPKKFLTKIKVTGAKAFIKIKDLF